MSAMPCTLTKLTIRLEAEKSEPEFGNVHGFMHNVTNKGWTYLDKGPPPSSLPVTFGLSTFLEEDEDNVNGETMLQRSTESVPTCGPLAGQHQLEQLLEHQELIPPELRGKCIVGLATKWRDQGGSRCVPYLFWFDGRWREEHT